MPLFAIVPESSEADAKAPVFNENVPTPPIRYPPLRYGNVIWFKAIVELGPTVPVVKGQKNPYLRFTWSGE